MTACFKENEVIRKMMKALESIKTYTEKVVPENLERAKSQLAVINMTASEAVAEAKANLVAA
jgi:hypothetical protein